jgi:hypothetical protein
MATASLGMTQTPSAPRIRYRAYDMGSGAAAVARAALQSYLLGELTKLSERPSMAEIDVSGYVLDASVAVTALTEPGVDGLPAPQSSGSTSRPT